MSPASSASSDRRERGDRRSRSPVAQRLHRDELHIPPVVPAVVPVQLLRAFAGDANQGLRGGRSLDSPQGLRGGQRHLPVWVLVEGLDQYGDYLAGADFPQGLSRIDTDVDVLVVQAFDQRRGLDHGVMAMQGLPLNLDLSPAQ